MEVETTNTESVDSYMETGQTGSDTAKTFTQEEVNEIVQRRLAKDRKNRGEDAGKNIEERERALIEKENAAYAKQMFSVNGLPEDLLGIVKGKEQKEVDEIIKILKPYVDKANEPIRNPVSGTGGVVGSDAIREAMGLTGRKA